MAKKVILKSFHLFTAKMTAYQLTHEDERLSYVYTFSEEDILSALGIKINAK